MIIAEVLVQASAQNLEIALNQLSRNTSWCFTTNSKLKEYNIDFDAHLLNAKVF
jgi:hypothetical protein